MATDTSQTDTTGEASAAPVATIQLTQVRVPLDEAAEALSTPDEAGRLPIVVLPKQAYRIRNGLVGAGVLLILGSLLFDVTLPLRGGSLAAGAVLVVLGVFQCVHGPGPGGFAGVLLRRGRFHRTLGPGNHIVIPTIIVSHIVTTRETPFDAPSTRDPHARRRADERRHPHDVPDRRAGEVRVHDLGPGLRPGLPGDVPGARSCSSVTRTPTRSSTWAMPTRSGSGRGSARRSSRTASRSSGSWLPTSCRRSSSWPRASPVGSQRPARRGGERHALALRQSDQEELERQRIRARREAIELEAANEVARLDRLEERLRAYPNAVHWDVETQRLDVARALAANTRAMVQVGPAADVAASLLLHTLPENGASPPAEIDTTALLAVTGERPRTSRRGEREVARRTRRDPPSRWVRTHRTRTGGPGGDGPLKRMTLLIMGCLLVMLGAFFPRLGVRLRGLARPALFEAAIPSTLVAGVGIIFFPLTTLMYVLLWAPGGLPPVSIGCGLRSPSSSTSAACSGRPTGTEERIPCGA